jgi:hypothetical protein
MGLSISHMVLLVHGLIFAALTTREEAGSLRSGTAFVKTGLPRTIANGCSNSTFEFVL